MCFVAAVRARLRLITSDVEISSSKETYVAFSAWDSGSGCLLWYWTVMPKARARFTTRCSSLVKLYWTWRLMERYSSDTSHPKNTKDFVLRIVAYCEVATPVTCRHISTTNLSTKSYWKTNIPCLRAFCAIVI